MPRSHRTAHMCMDMALAMFFMFFQLLIIRLLCLIHVAWICCPPDILWTTVTGNSFIEGPSKHQALPKGPAHSGTGGSRCKLERVSDH